MNKTVIIIPARWDSVRFPGKPLVDIDGHTMIARVVAQAKKVKACDKVVVATDDDRIAKAVQGRCEVIMTESDPWLIKTGSDRCAQAARIMELDPQDNVINLQGDMPFVPPELCDDLILFLKRETYPIVTPAIARTDPYPGAVHVIVGSNDRALYFSRLPLIQEKGGRGLHHIGIYGFKNGTLQRFSDLPQPTMELEEGLEQLRALYYGIPIGAMLTDIDCGREINVKADLKGVK